MGGKQLNVNRGVMEDHTDRVSREYANAQSAYELNANTRQAFGDDTDGGIASAENQARAQAQRHNQEQVDAAGRKGLRGVQENMEELLSHAQRSTREL